MSEIEYLAAGAYADDVDPITWAVGVISDFVSLYVEINAGRHANPGAFPTYGPDATADHMARRAVAGLLDAGWTPPDEAACAAAGHRIRVEREWFAAHRHEPCRCGHLIVAHVAAPGGACTDCPDSCFAWKPERGLSA